MLSHRFDFWRRWNTISERPCSHDHMMQVRIHPNLPKILGETLNLGLNTYTLCHLTWLNLPIKFFTLLLFTLLWLTTTGYDSKRWAYIQDIWMLRPTSGLKWKSYKCVKLTWAIRMVCNFSTPAPDIISIIFLHTIINYVYFASYAVIILYML